VEAVTLGLWPLIAYFAILMALSLLMRDAVLRFLLTHGVTAPNYQERLIPSAAGILIWLTAAAALLLLSAWTSIAGDLELAAAGEYYKSYCLALTIVFCLGWTDDLIGNRGVKGLRGHLRAWLKERTISTGWAKAVFTAAASAWFILDSGIWRGAMFGVLPLAVMTLSTHALNLFDLRPGRAIKVFLFGGLIAVSAAHWQAGAWVMLLPAIAGALVLLPLDLRGEGMLGDTGANMLGFALGSAIAVHWGWAGQAVAACALAALAIFAERHSLTRTIERLPLLHWLDRLGRE